MVSEVASILTFAGGVSVARVQWKDRPDSLRRLLSLLVALALLDLAVLGGSGYLRERDGILAIIHTVAGHLLLPLVATAAGLRLGTSFGGTRRPFRVIGLLFFLLVLCFFCWSNTRTGYLGPSRLHPGNPDNCVRFTVLHRWGVPIIIGTMLLSWLLRLAVRGPLRLPERTSPKVMQ